MSTVEVSVGAVVHAGDVLARLLQPGPRWIEVAVEPGEAAGDAYTVEVDGRWLPAQRLAAGMFVGPDGMRRDRLEIGDGGESLPPGAVVAVRVQHGPAEGIVLPADAVVATPAGSVVYLRSAPETFVQRPVTVLARGDGKVRVAGQLAAGDQVVRRGVMGLHGETLRNELRHTE